MPASGGLSTGAGESLKLRGDTAVPLSLMPWLFAVLSVACLAFAFRTHSVGLALISLAAALGLMIAAALGFASARIGSRSRLDSEVLSPDALASIGSPPAGERQEPTLAPAAAHPNESSVASGDDPEDFSVASPPDARG